MYLHLLSSVFSVFCQSSIVSVLLQSLIQPAALPILAEVGFKRSRRAIEPHVLGYSLEVSAKHSKLSHCDHASDTYFARNSEPVVSSSSLIAQSVERQAFNLVVQSSSLC